MRIKILSVYIIIFFILLLLAGYFFLYNIYGVEVKKSSNYLFADFKSEMMIEVYPVNALGKKALFRKSSAKFIIVEGSELVSVIEHSPAVGILKIKANGMIGIVGIKIKSDYSLFPDYLEIEILPLTV